MDRLKAMEAFVTVARTGGFAAAAREMGISTSAMSRHIADLESWFDVQLLHRTTRKISLSPAGEQRLARFSQILDAVSALEAEARGMSAHPSGEVRITAPIFFAKHFLAPTISRFLVAQPDVQIRLCLMDRVANLIEEGFDLAIRIGHLEDSSLVGRRIGKMRVVATASPQYLSHHGMPETVADLKNHNCIVDLTPRHGNRWPFSKSGRQKPFEVSGSLFANDGELVREITLGGHGISLLPDFFVKEDIEDGRLIQLLVEFTEEEVGIYLVYARERHRSAGVQSVIDFIAEESDSNDL